MDTRRALVSKRYEVGPLLQRRFWKPLRDMMEIFHVLPLAAAVVCFVLFATDGQFREIYIAYLEVPGESLTRWIASFVVAAFVLGLLSAVLYEAHFLLSTLRITVVYSGYSNPDARSSPRDLQRTSAFVLALFPWLGIAIGLFNARNFVADRYCQLFSQMLPADDLHRMQHLLLPGGWTIAAAMIFLGAAMATFSCVDQQTRIAQRAIALLAPALAVLLLLLFTDWLIPDFENGWSIFFCAIALAATIGYFEIYRSLYRRRGGPFFTRTHTTGALNIEPPIVVPRSRAELLNMWALSPLWFLIGRPEFATGISLGNRRRLLLVIWAILPWVLFALYFAIVPHLESSSQSADLWAQSQSKAPSEPQTQCPIAGTSLPVPGHWTVFPVAMCLTIGLGLLIGLLLNRIPEQWTWRRIAVRRRFVVMALVVILALAAKAASLFGPDIIVSLYRFVGPLATVALQLLFLISVFALLAWLSQRSGFPVLTLAILAVVACVMFPDHVGLVAILLGLACVFLALAAFLAGFAAVGAVALVLIILGIIQWNELRVDMVAQNSDVPTSGVVDQDTVKFQFECWLGQRGIDVQDPESADLRDKTCPKTVHGPQQYTVYIIATEGGGIYAASAASMLLARLQDASPHFAKHVFAVSGVSGGAIGSAIFQALDRAASTQQGKTITVSDDSCLKYPAETPIGYRRQCLEDKVTEIMEDDHFSPVVGSIFSELLGSSTGRAEALVQSFGDSVSAYDAAAGEVLGAPFKRHWSFDGVAPALVLNSTWVETGFRVAFSPFHLHNIDESLYSFSDEGMPDEHENTLMQAAAVSARFPLVLPPFSAVMAASATDKNDRKRWNFVDGGYSDNSGAATALDLYTVLKSVSPPGVDVRIVLLTSSQLQPDLFSKQISGTAFRDTMAPIDALMSVRRDLGNQAVARACSEIYPEKGGLERPSTGTGPGVYAEANERCNKHARDPAPPLQIVEIQDQTYGLSLGWKISQTSFDVVSWMLGTPGKCPSQTPGRTPSPVVAATPTTSYQRDDAQLTKAILERNSCVLQSIIDFARD
jgi:hypothetical protein